MKKWLKSVMDIREVKDGLSMLEKSYATRRSITINGLLGNELTSHTASATPAMKLQKQGLNEIELGRSFMMGLQQQMSTASGSSNESSNSMVDDVIDGCSVMKLAVLDALGHFDESIGLIEKEMIPRMRLRRLETVEEELTNCLHRLYIHRGEFGRVITYHSSLGTANSNLGIALAMTGETQKALDVLKSSSARDAASKVNLAVLTAEKAGSIDEAVKQLDELKSSTAASTAEHQCVLLECVATHHLNKGNEAKAAEAIGRALPIAEQLIAKSRPWELGGAHARLANTLLLQARLLGKTGQFTSAEGLFTTAISRLEMISHSKPVHRREMLHAVRHFGDMLARQDKRRSTGEELVKRAEILLKESAKDGQISMLCLVHGWTPSPAVFE